MKSHPSPEQWMAYLYAEDTPGEHATLGEHLNHCALCQRQVRQWQETARALDAWRLAGTRSRSFSQFFSSRRIGWAAAAALFIGTGLLLGRFSSTPPDAQQLQTALHHYVDHQLENSRREWLQLLERRQNELAQSLRDAAATAASAEARQSFAQYARNLEEQLEADRQTILATFRQLDERRETDISALREDLQTVAVNADASLNLTQEQLMQLASAAKTDLP